MKSPHRSHHVGWAWLQGWKLCPSPFPSGSWGSWVLLRTLMMPTRLSRSGTFAELILRALVLSRRGGEHGECAPDRSTCTLLCLRSRSSMNSPKDIVSLRPCAAPSSLSIEKQDERHCKYTICLLFYLKVIMIQGFHKYSIHYFILKFIIVFWCWSVNCCNSTLGLFLFLASQHKFCICNYSFQIIVYYNCIPQQWLVVTIFTRVCINITMRYLSISIWCYLIFSLYYISGWALFTPPHLSDSFSFQMNILHKIIYDAVVSLLIFPK